MPSLVGDNNKCTMEAAYGSVCVHGLGVKICLTLDYLGLGWSRFLVMAHHGSQPAAIQQTGTGNDWDIL